MLDKIINFTKLNDLPKYKKPSVKNINDFKKEKIFINQIDILCFLIVSLDLQKLWESVGALN